MRHIGADRQGPVIGQWRLEASGFEEFAETGLGYERQIVFDGAMALFLVFGIHAGVQFPTPPSGHDPVEIIGTPFPLNIGNGQRRPRNEPRRQSGEKGLFTANSGRVRQEMHDQQGQGTVERGRFGDGIDGAFDQCDTVLEAGLGDTLLGFTQHLRRRIETGKAPFRMQSGQDLDLAAQAGTGDQDRRFVAEERPQNHAGQLVQDLIAGAYAAYVRCLIAVSPSSSGLSSPPVHGCLRGLLACRAGRRMMA